MIRRVLDIVVAGALLVLISPVVLVIAVMNWLAVRRVFFRQVRVGRGLEPFTISKFQTMVDDAQRGGTVTARGDARITPLGRLLRATKLDELPQLLNVLRGQMSLVGPRPLTPNEVAAIAPALAGRIYASAPGMTGIASVAFIDEERVLASSADPQTAYFDVVLPRKVAMELAYASRRTWLTDLVIVLITPVAGLSDRVRRAVLTWLVPAGYDQVDT
jgi:lipopolysaccharide/colanic/teichoic acid biosynthesis glycosyltransferase